MTTFPTLRTRVDWAGLVDAPALLSWAMSTRAPYIGGVGMVPLDYAVPLAEAPGATACDDLAYNGTWTPTRVAFGGGPLDARDDATSATFGGTSYVTLALAGSITAGSVMALVRARTFGGYVYASSAGGLALRVDASGFLVLSVVGTGDICTATSSLVIGRAHHVAATYDGTTARLYLDGADVSGATTVRATGSPATAYIGALNTTSGGWWGDLADVLLWSGGVLSGRDVAYLASLVRDPFGETNADVSAWTTEALDVTRGRSGDMSADAKGSATFTLRNHDDRFTEDRNWATNGSLETDLSVWSTDSGIHIGPGALDLRRVVDNAGLGGRWAGECDLSALPGAGIAYDINRAVAGAQQYTASVALKGVAGATAVTIGLGSLVDAGDVATAAVALTGSWQVVSVTWTPTTDFDACRFFIRGQAPAAATFRIDALTIAPGPGATFIEAPTRDQLVPGRSVLVTATYEGVEAALFFGRVEKLSPDPVTRRVAVQAYDMFGELARRTVPSYAVTGSHRELRADILRRAFSGGRNDYTGRGNLEGAMTFTTAGTTKLAARSLQEVPSGEFITFSGEIRALNAWSPPVTLRIGTGSKTQDRTITVGGDWTPFTHVAESTGVDWYTYGFVSTGAGNYEVRRVMLNASAARFPYIAYGDGYARSYARNGARANPSMEAWTRGWTSGMWNRCTNPSFETNTTGWSVAADTIHGTAGTSITRTAGGYHGSWCGRVVVPAYGGAHFNLSGITFKAGETYLAYIRVRGVGAPLQMNAGIQAQASGDGALTPSLVTVSNTAWTPVGVSWTPAADRTDVHFGFYQYSGAMTFDVDGLIVYRCPPPDGYQLDMADPLLLDAGSTDSTFVLDETDGVYGGGCLRIATGNTVVFPMQQVGAWEVSPEPIASFEPGVWYTASVWVKAGAGKTITLAFGRQSKPATAGTTTYTTTGAGWERVVVRWRPAADGLANTDVFRDVFVSIRSSGGAGTKIDGLLVTEGRRPWPYEGRWADALDPGETAWKVLSARLTGTVLGTLEKLNSINLTVHRIDPVPAFPWWRYVTRTRGRLPEKQVAETFDDDLTGATGWERSFDSVRNVVRVTTGTQWLDTTTNTAQTNPNSGQWVVSDPDSVLQYGRVDGPTLGDTMLENRLGDPSLQDDLAAAVVERYREPRARPTIYTENRWPSQLLRNPDDLVRVTFPRAGKYGSLYLISSMALHIEANGRLWRAAYTLEEHAYTPSEDGTLAGGMPEYTGPEASLALGMPQ